MRTIGSEVDEPVFSMQEQAVVYLFSRYWELLEQFKDRRLTRIHTHFPDCFVAEAGKENEGVEFEYGLKGFRTHFGHDLKKLAKAKLKRLFVVYWDRNDDETEIAAQIARASIRPVFICLKDYFKAHVTDDGPQAPLRPSWRFSSKESCDAYTMGDVKSATESLIGRGSFTEAPVVRDLYRTIGFDKRDSDFIECDHWGKIHFFTTNTRLSSAQIPRKLFVKPNSYHHFIGYFEIATALKVVAIDEQVEYFFRRFYFYPARADDGSSYLDYGWWCFVCSFRPLDYKRGRDLYNFLSPHYKLGVRGSRLINNEKHIERINEICG